MLSLSHSLDPLGPHIVLKRSQVPTFFKYPLWMVQMLCTACPKRNNARKASVKNLVLLADDWLRDGQ